VTDERAVRHPVPQTNPGRPAPCCPGTGAANARNDYGHQSQHLTAGGTTHGPGFYQRDKQNVLKEDSDPLDTVTATHLRFSLTKDRGGATAVERMSSCEHAGMDIMAGKGLIALGSGVIRLWLFLNTRCPLYTHPETDPGSYSDNRNAACRLDQ
jgi:hypothetical protein